MTAPRFWYDAATARMVGPGPHAPCRVALDAVPAIAARWRSRGYSDVADALEADAAEVVR